MARGITQNQVDEAAGAILSAGENPTVEKVRAQLGTGSPNTITRMLDAWRSQLGSRLRQLSALPEVPDAVGQAMIEIWRLAVDHAERVLDERFANERSTLEIAQTRLTQEREGWVARLEAAEVTVARTQAAKDLAEHACATLDGQLQDSHALRADLVQQRDRLQDRCDQQAEEIGALRSQIEEVQTIRRSEHERQDAHIRAIEDRSHAEVDRARQDAKQWQQRFESLERAHRDAVVALQRRHELIDEQVRRLEQEAARQSGQVQGLEKALLEAHAAAKTKRLPVPPGKRAKPIKASVRPSEPKKRTRQR